MSDLLDKYKNSQLTPHGQMLVENFISWREKKEEENKKAERLKFIEKCFVVFSILAIAFTAYNMHEYNKSFDNCLRLLEQIEVNSAILDQEINTLSKSINGALEVDYE